jgi:hypothetical protein
MVGLKRGHFKADLDFTFFHKMLTPEQFFVATVRKTFLPSRLVTVLLHTSTAQKIQDGIRPCHF